jgi:hypothetical protein
MKRISMSHCRRRLFEAFTRLDLVVVAGSVFLVLALALPALASKARSQQAVCFNNLREIGRAFHLWGNDHGNLFPLYVPPAQGGTFVGMTGGGTTTWVQYGALSNELSSPQLLACPSDNRRVATEFSSDPNKGLFHNNFRDNAISYFICADADWKLPWMLLGGDRNIKWDNFDATCSSAGTPVYRLAGSTSGRWTNSLHLNAGHWLYVDGRVSFVDNMYFAGNWPRVGDGYNDCHFLAP